jgi:hypothetical protein
MGLVSSGTARAEAEGVTDFQNNFMRVALDGVAKRLFLESRADAPFDSGLRRSFAIIPMPSPNGWRLRDTQSAARE